MSDTWLITVFISSVALMLTCIAYIGEITDFITDFITNIPKFFNNQFHKFKNQSVMINTKVLLKAMGFMFLPTLSLLCVIFFWFFDWTAFITFVTSSSVGASILRIIMLVLEFILVYIMYEKYLEEENRKNLFEDLRSKKFGTLIRENGMDYETSRFLGGINDYSIKKGRVYQTDDSDVFVVEIKNKTQA